MIVHVILMVENVTRDKNGIMISVSVSEEDYAWNPCTYDYECNKGCEIEKYLKDCECMKIVVDDLIATCDEVEDTPKIRPINPSDGINYWLIVVVLVAIARLLFLVVIVVNYCIKRGLTIPCLLLY